MEWYVERKARCINQIWRVADDLLQSDHDVILELGLIRRSDRLAFYDRMNGAGHDYTVYVLDVARSIRKDRVEKRNVQQGPTFSMVVPSEIFEMASNMWESPEQDEIASCNMKFPAAS